ncbi:hypothetical protein Nocox_27095 [Nonomuraea coxensis DSM 45129]|uniref:DUF1015 domain-containing protein n=1 Tax=Nonomuraea coxensis DSM 45129 TaxID=1122611 RepID=A0ABX8U8G7_9ACTN|nr:DUF1015 domain-containing protein [Nonomuraea coxensis]QYC43018.1 hypothetical protein Nocox_27095 [Nonomuraea coxensis DSM 45129]
MGTPELPVPGGLVLRPFRGVRFAVEDPAKVTSPPYDLISDADVDTLLHLHPNNVVRLILPRASHPGSAHAVAADGELAPETRYAEARDTLQSWLRAGILVPDDRPALYVYEQHGRHFLQRGLIGDVALTDPGQHVILPHEDVMPGPIADRLALMSTTQANLEPIFLLYDGSDGSTTRLVEEVATRRRPLVSAETEDGVTHRLWAIIDPSEIAVINADLRDRQALIADGHHRYATYRVLQRQERLAHPPTDPSPAPSDTTPAGAALSSDATQSGDAAAAASEPAHTSRAAGSQAPPPTTLIAPWDFGLALLVDSTAYPPDLKAIHRVIPGLPLAKAAAQARQSWRVQEFGTLAEGLAAFETSPDPAFLLADEGGAYLITDPDPVQLARAMPADHSDRWNSLNTSILSEFILPKVWGMRDDEQAVRIVHHDIQAAAELATSTGGTAVILKPLATEDVLAVAAGGERVPRKSTSFGPKPRTGLVLRTFAIN